MDLVKVVPNSFGLTNAPWIGQDYIPGLNYFVNAKQVPFHRDWYEMMCSWASIPRFGGALTSPGLHRFSGFDWNREPSPAMRDELHLKGYNYVGRHASYGVVCWGHNVTLPDGKTFTPLVTALTAVALLRELASIAYAVSSSAAVSNDPHYIGQLLAHYISRVVSEAINRRLLYLPSGAHSNGVSYNADEGCVEVHVQQTMQLSYGLMRVYPNPNTHTSPTVVEVSGTLANLPDLLRILYLPGTMEFKNLHVAVRQ